MPKDNSGFSSHQFNQLIVLKKKWNRKAEFLGVEWGRQISSEKHMIIMKGEVILKYLYEH